MRTKIRVTHREAHLQRREPYLECVSNGIDAVQHNRVLLEISLSRVYIRAAIPSASPS
jgi:hypothetical protein